MLVRVNVEACGKLYETVPSFSIDYRPRYGADVLKDELLLVIGLHLHAGWLIVLTHNQGVVLVARDYFKEAL